MEICGCCIMEEYFEGRDKFSDNVSFQGRGWKKGTFLGAQVWI